ncbi:MAG: nucleoside deaminase [Bacteroidales bacterium]|nr:nucleoside deaminase [Bacteroidales bacterium]
MQDIFTDKYFMKRALMQARLAFEKNEIPVGAIVVFKNRVIAGAHNLSETLNDATAHAEMQVITAAANRLGGKYLKECTLYVTAEPCAMCAGATYWSQIGRIVYGASDEKKGYQKFCERIIHPKTEITGGVLEFECSELISAFFSKIRNA